MQFDSPTALATHLYDRAVRPGMTPRERVLLAAQSAQKATEVYTEGEP